jgi:hypothetical protein
VGNKLLWLAHQYGHLATTQTKKKRRRKKKRTWCRWQEGGTIFGALVEGKRERPCRLAAGSQQVVVVGRGKTRRRRA